jgi:predicted nucleic acid-binding protein
MTAEGSPSWNDSCVDTSFRIATLFRGLPHGRASTALAERLVTTQTRIVFATILRLELSQVLARLPKDDRFPEEFRRTFRLHRCDADADVRSAWMTEGIRRFELLLQRFALVSEVPFDLPIWHSSIDVMVRHRLRSHDAIHVATARAAGVARFVTLDADFGRVPDLRLALIRDTSA